jgi:hypothetical protein
MDWNGMGYRPIKPWQLCTDREKELELVLACSLDVVVEQAILDGIADEFHSGLPVPSNPCIAGILLPDPEDVVRNHGQFPSRDMRWEEFMKWYAGDEFVQRIPGKGIPTLPRVNPCHQCIV